MTPDSFIPFGKVLKHSSGSDFVGHGDTDSSPTEAGENTPATVTPAATHDLESQLRKILQGQVSGEALEATILSITSTIQNIPSRVALPEIKIHALGDTLTEGQPTIDFEREGDTIKRVQVNCACGQSIHLDCIY